MSIDQIRNRSICNILKIFLNLNFYPTTDQHLFQILLKISRCLEMIFKDLLPIYINYYNE
jgi:hypothetical protein